MLGIYLLILSQFIAAFFIIAITIITLSKKMYRQIFKNKHFWLALILLIIALLPYLHALIGLNFLPLKILFSLHYSQTSASWWHWGDFADFWNIMLSDINLFLLMGFVLIIMRFKKIWHDNLLFACLILSAIIFICFAIISLHSSTMLKFYLPFYLSFVLLFVPVAVEKCPKLLSFAIWANVLVLLINSWNAVFPQYGVSPGSNGFYNRNNQNLAKQFSAIIKPDDLLVACMPGNNIAQNMNAYLNIATFAFYLGHTKTYASIPGYFLWQPKLEALLKQNPTQKMFYVCNTPIKTVYNFNCGSQQTLTAAQDNNKYVTHFLYQQCVKS